MFSRLSLNYWPTSFVVKFMFLLCAMSYPNDFFCGQKLNRLVSCKIVNLQEEETYLGNNGLHWHGRGTWTWACSCTAISAAFVAIRALASWTLVFGLLQMLLKSALQVSDLLHQTLFELILANSLRLLLGVEMRLSVTFSSLLGRNSLSSRWLARALGCSNFLVLHEVLKWLVGLWITPFRLIYLLYEIWQTLNVLTGWVLHAQSGTRARASFWNCLCRLDFVWRWHYLCMALCMTRAYFEVWVKDMLVWGQGLCLH